MRTASRRCARAGGGADDLTRAAGVLGAGTGATRDWNGVRAAQALSRCGQGALQAEQRSPQRSGQPRGGKANHDRIHVETHGQGSIRGAERDWGGLTRTESEFARELAQRGFHVHIIPKQLGKRTPDFMVNGTTIELKTLQSFGRRTLEQRIKKSLGQNPDIIIINCRNVAADLPSVQQQIGTVEATKRISLQGKVIVWMPDGSAYAH